MSESFRSLADIVRRIATDDMGAEAGTASLTRIWMNAAELYAVFARRGTEGFSTKLLGNGPPPEPDFDQSYDELTDLTTLKFYGDPKFWRPGEVERYWLFVWGLIQARIAEEAGLPHDIGACKATRIGGGDGVVIESVTHPRERWRERALDTATVLDVLADRINGSVDSVTFELSADSRTLRHGKHQWVFSPKQAAIVTELFAAYQRGTPQLSQEYLFDRAGSDAKRMSHIFGGCDGWKDIIVKGVKKDMWQLQPPRN